MIQPMLWGVGTWAYGLSPYAGVESLLAVAGWECLSLGVPGSRRLR
jgi:hypothetical protein